MPRKNAVMGMRAVFDLKKKGVSRGCHIACISRFANIHLYTRYICVVFVYLKKKKDIRTEEEDARAMSLARANRLRLQIDNGYKVRIIRSRLLVASGDGRGYASAVDGSGREDASCCRCPGALGSGSGGDAAAGRP